MQSSSAARAVLLAATLSITIVYFPIYLTPDALAQTVALPTPQLTTLVATSTPIQSTTTVATPVQTTNVPVKTNTKTVATVSGATSDNSAEQLVIPSINLDDPIVPVGIDSTGAMAVPNGKTDEVGWWDGGPQAGQIGSAVLDAHVFAAFSKLNQVQVGDSIYVEQNGRSLHFVVTKVETYPLSQITSQDLFVQTSDRDLNLITCAGKLIDNNTNYDHRLVVYSTLVE